MLNVALEDRGARPHGSGDHEADVARGGHERRGLALEEIGSDLEVGKEDGLAGRVVHRDRGVHGALAESLAVRPQAPHHVPVAEAVGLIVRGLAQVRRGALEVDHLQPLVARDRVGPPAQHLHAHEGPSDGVGRDARSADPVGPRVVRHVEDIEVRGLGLVGARRRDDHDALAERRALLARDVHGRFATVLKVAWLMLCPAVVAPSNVIPVGCAGLDRS